MFHITEQSRSDRIEPGFADEARMDDHVYEPDDYEDFGNQSGYHDDNDEVVLFRSLEHELESLVQRYRVPPNELQQLFEVKSNHSVAHGAHTLNTLGLDSKPQGHIILKCPPYLYFYCTQNPLQSRGYHEFCDLPLLNLPVALMANTTDS